MTRRSLVMSFVSVVLGLSFVFQGCGTPVVDGIPVAITPPGVQVAVNNTVSINISLSIPRQKEGTLYIIIDNPEIVLPAAQTTEVKVAAGVSSVPFSLQGIKAGRTTIRARMENEGEVVSTSVLVTP